MSFGTVAGILKTIKDAAPGLVVYIERNAENVTPLLRKIAELPQKKKTSSQSRESPVSKEQRLKYSRMHISTRSTVF
jgi:hypothetical protein